MAGAFLDRVESPFQRRTQVGAPEPLDEVEHLLRPDPPTFADAHPVQFPVEDECPFPVEERHVVLHPDPLAAERAPRMREQQRRAPLGSPGVLPDRRHVPVDAPPAVLDPRAPPAVPLVFAACPGEVGESGEVRGHMEALVAADAEETAHGQAGCRPGNASPVVSGSPCMTLNACTACPAAPFMRLSIALRTTTRSASGSHSKPTSQ